MTEMMDIFDSQPEAEDFYGPHEFHVTTDPTTTARGVFEQACGTLGVKAHIIYNETPHGESVTDYLTGSLKECTSLESLAELGRIAHGLRSAGLDVVRQKIEVSRSHPLAPRLPSDHLPAGSYFESHFTLPDLPTIHGRGRLEWRGVPLLISTTDNKRRQGLLFATLRHYTTTSGDFRTNIQELHRTLTKQLRYVKWPTIEYAMYDSKPEHDSDWVNSYRDLDFGEIEQPSAHL
jgi:hypothetical protein